MNLARVFPYAARLESQLSAERAKVAKLEAGAARDAEELQRLREEIRQGNDNYALRLAAEAVRDSHLAQIESLTLQVSGLTDRLCLRGSTVPLSEPLTKPQAVESDQGTPNFTNLVDQSIKRTGPVAAARQRAEDEDALRQADEMEQRRRLGSRASVPGKAPLLDDEELSDVVQRSATASG